VSIPWPRCGDEDPHPAHPGTGFGDLDCPGWTARQQLVRHLVISVREYMREHYWPVPPPGLRLEMHPSVRQWLLMDADLLMEGAWPGEEVGPDDFLPVPVKVNLDLKRDQWRLVIVTEEVLLGGKAP
jgi:hypothetical protein